MRLVCDKCSAIYTIEDNLVGVRDFRVSCKQCGEPILVRSAHQVPSERPAGMLGGLPPPALGLLSAPRASARPAAFDSTRPSVPQSTRPMVSASASQSALPMHESARPASHSFVPAGGEAWFVSLGGAQQGPYSASEFSRLLEQERLDWTTPVWREGLKDWRPARRDAVLVTAVAGARGNAGDTMRLNSSRSFLAPEDTVVDLRPQALHPSSPQVPVVDDLLSSASETQTIDARSPAVAAAIPKLTPSSRPAAWSSPENASFRAGLGMPADSMQIPKPESTVQPVAAATLADAFRSAPALLRAGQATDSTAEYQLGSQVQSAAAESWMPKPQSMLMVAAMAFAAGVVAAAAWGYFGTNKPAPVAAAPGVVTAPAKPALPTLGAKPEIKPVPSTESLRELPDPEELRAEVRHVAPDVKRCVDDPALGVDVDIYLDGPSGRVRDVDVRSPALPPGRVACVSHAVRQMQLVPFMRQELKLMHKFSW